MQEKGSKYVFEPATNLDMSENSQLDIQKWPTSMPPSNKNLIPLKQKQVSCIKIMFPQFCLTGITFPLSLMMFIYFWISYIYGFSKLTGCVAYELGAKFTPAIREGQIHRLIVTVPLYSSIIQMAIGTLTLQMYGHVAEHNLGWKVYISGIIIACYCSLTLSAVIYPYYVSVGSMGISWFVLIAYGHKLYNFEMGEVKRFVAAIYGLMICVNIIPIFSTNQLDAAILFGGSISSMLTVIINTEFKETKGRILRAFGLLSLILFVTIPTGLIFVIQVDQIDIHHWC